METLIQPDFVLKRRKCNHCGEDMFEFFEDLKVTKYICSDCSTLT